VAPNVSRTCPKCSANLKAAGTVTRTFVPPEGGTVQLGRYDSWGHFDPGAVAGTPKANLDSRVSDSCSGCRTVLL